MTVAVSGANGFTGRFVCSELQSRQIPFFALLRPGADTSWMTARNIPVRFADLGNPSLLQFQLSGCNALLNLVSIGSGVAPAILQACRGADVRRLVFVSTTAIFTQLNAASKSVRKAAEASIKSSGLDTTIIRPTMIYGTPADRNMIRLVRWLDRWPALPVFGNGRSLQQPVHVSDVAWAIVQALLVPTTIGREYNISGAAPLTYNEVVRLTAQALERRGRCLHIPAQPMVAFLRATERLGIPFSIRSEQILRLNEDKVFSHQEATDTFGFAPISFEQGICQEVALYRSLRDGLS
jgi:nucleoside-diphosphate-sugar epimerase